MEACSGLSLEYNQRTGTIYKKKKKNFPQFLKRSISAPICINTNTDAAQSLKYSLKTFTDYGNLFGVNMRFSLADITQSPGARYRKRSKNFWKRDSVACESDLVSL